MKLVPVLSMLVPVLSMLSVVACGGAARGPAAPPPPADLPEARVPDDVRALVEREAHALVDDGKVPALAIALVDEHGAAFLSYGQVRAGGPAT